MTSSFLEMGLAHHGVRLGLVLHVLKSVWHSNGYEVDEFIVSRDTFGIASTIAWTAASGFLMCLAQQGV